MFVMDRRGLLLGASALALTGTLAACNGSGGGTAISADDIVLGAEDAPVTMIEYASATCGHCATFHETVWDQLKATYIDTGKVRFIFREFPTAPAAVAVAGFQLARCGGASNEQYFARLGEIFRQQQAIFATGSMEGIRGKFIEIGSAAGLSADQINECIADPAGGERATRIIEESRAFNVTGTPTLIVNGRKLEEPDAQTWEGLSRILEAELAS